MCRGTVEVCTGNVICGKWRKLTTSSSIYGQGLSTICFTVGKFGMCRGTVEICTGNVICGKKGILTQPPRPRFITSCASGKYGMCWGTVEVFTGNKIRAWRPQYAKSFENSIFPPENLVCAGGLSKFSPET